LNTENNQADSGSIVEKGDNMTIFSIEDALKAVEQNPEEFKGSLGCPTKQRAAAKLTFIPKYI